MAGKQNIQQVVFGVAALLILTGAVLFIARGVQDMYHEVAEAESSARMQMVEGAISQIGEASMAKIEKVTEASVEASRLIGLATLVYLGLENGPGGVLIQQEGKRVRVLDSLKQHAGKDLSKSLDHPFLDLSDIKNYKITTPEEGGWMPGPMETRTPAYVVEYATETGNVPTRVLIAFPEPETEK